MGGHTEAWKRAPKMAYDSWLIAVTITLVYDEKNLFNSLRFMVPLLCFVKDHYKGLLTDGLSSTWDHGTLETSSLPLFPSLSPQTSLDCLYSLPNAKIWTKLHKIRKASLSNLQSTPAVSYQNTDTCRKLPMECYYFTTERRACREVDIWGQGEWKLSFDG